jgi:glycosyltransferase involved in cell wall biosynthesis
MVLDDDVVQRIQFHTRKLKISPDFYKKAEALPQTRHVDITQSGDRRTKHASAPYAGEGAQREFLEQESKHLNVADLHVLPSEYEPFGMVVNEAMLCGCITAASNQLGAITDLVLPVDPSLVFKCGDISALSLLLTRILADRPALAALRQKALQRMQSWSPREYVSSILAALDRAVPRLRP